MTAAENRQLRGERDRLRRELASAKADLKAASVVRKLSRSDYGRFARRIAEAVASPNVKLYGRDNHFKKMDEGIRRLARAEGGGEIALEDRIDEH